MVGSIVKEDIEEIKSRVRLDEVVSAYLTITPASGGAYKGLCPFHDEKTPSFMVRSAINIWHCFGCGAGGDTIDFVRRIENLPFVEAVELIAKKYGIQLRYEKGRAQADGATSGIKQRILDAHKVAQEFYEAQIQTDQADLALSFLQDRGFAPQVVKHFGIGYSPNAWDEITRHLRKNGFTEEQIEKSGLAKRGPKGIYDRFRGRLMWPIRSLAGQTVGFGARRINDEEDTPKYLNSPETIVYKKSQVLYGIDLARKAIAKQKTVVVVEGYTDVMAAHVAGIETAVAACGTAFGSEHISVLRRIMGDIADISTGVQLASGTSLGGQVIFTFDGDAAGQKAAMRAFAEDQKFAAQTYVVILPGGLDPCDLRLQQGDRAIVDALEDKRPLFEFVMKSHLKAYDLYTAEGRVGAIQTIAPLVSDIRDKALRLEYVRAVSNWTGMPLESVKDAVATATRIKRSKTQMTYSTRVMSEIPGESNPLSLRKIEADALIRVESFGLKAILQYPKVAAENGFELLNGEFWQQTAFRAIFDAVWAAGGVYQWQEIFMQKQAQGITIEQALQAAYTQWIELIKEYLPASLHGILYEISVSAIPANNEDECLRFAIGAIKALVMRSLTRKVGDLKREMNMLGAQDERREALFSQIVDLEKQRRQMQNS